jgi:hypothetical protein
MQPRSERSCRIGCAVLAVPDTGPVGEAFLTIVGLCGTITAIWLAVVGVRGVSKSLPNDAERIRWHYFKIGYPTMLIGMVAGAALALFAESRLAIAVNTMSGVGVLVAGLLIGMAPGMTIATRGGRAYQRALDAHYEGTRWARPSKR